MALYWTPKPEAATYRYTWVPALVGDDTIVSYTVTATGATIEAQEISENAVMLAVSGGAVGVVAVFEFTALAASGEQLAETVYLPIRATTQSLGHTARDICAFALRKVVGNGENASADEMADAIERLNDMLAAWATQGADLGVPLPVDENTQLFVADAFARALKNNMILQLADLYGADIGPVVVENARRGLQQVKTALMPVEREPVGEYF